jgi:chemotaxis signal transduction protein
VVDLVRFFRLPVEAKNRSSNGGNENDDPRQEGHAEKGGQENHLVVVRVSEMEMALLVADVLAVETIPASRMQEAAGTVRGLRPEYVRGVAERRGSVGAPANGKATMITVLDLPALLADERLIVHEEIV